MNKEMYSKEMTISEMSLLPTVSIVIVNLNGLKHLRECFRSILALRYPKEKIEIIMVDNASSDGSVAFVEKKFPMVRILQNERNEGFAKPSNDGARAATGEYVAFLNNDMRVSRDWLIELVASLRSNQADCAGSVILNWNGELLDFAGGGISFAGFGFQNDFHKPISEMEPLLQEDRELFFACGGSMLIRKDIFLSSGGFDEDFFAYYEDVDLGWRLRLLGYKIVLSVKSRVMHKHNSTSATMSRDRVQYLLERNKLYTCYKNYGEERLYKIFFPTVLLHIREAFIAGGVDAYQFHIENSEHYVPSDIAMHTNGILRFGALDEFVRNIAKYTEKRNLIQQNRKTSDENMNAYFEEPFMVFPKDTPGYLNSEHELIQLFGIDHLFDRQLKTKVLLISNDNVGQKMAGTGIRYWELAKSLENTGKFQVTLAVPNECDISYGNINIVSYTSENYGELQQAAKECVVVLLMGFVLDVLPKLREIVRQKYVIVDIYDPFVIESLEVFRDEELNFKNKRYEEAATSLEYQLKLGDFFLCADSKQQDYWIGMLAALHRVSPELYAANRNCTGLINTVPFGISDEPPVHTRQVLKGVWPGIEKDDFVLIWGGGVWNWFDPITLIKAMKVLEGRHPKIKLFFMGVRHPNPAVSQFRMLNDAVALSKELGLYDKSVFFNFGWVEYADRQNFLLEADAGVSCHFNTLETRFAFRTRILDYLWASLPIVCTEGDSFSELIEREKLGLTVKFEDEQELAQAIERVYQNSTFREACRAHIPAVAARFHWSVVSQPVVDYCLAPTHFRQIPSSMPVSSPKNVLPMEERSGRDGTMEYSSAHGRGESVRDLLYQVRNQQNELHRMLRLTMKQSRTSDNRLSELQTWSYMMNDRFNKAKILMNPLRAIKRLLKRR